MTKKTEEVDGEDRMIWSGQCDECMSIIYVHASDDTFGGDRDAISNQWPKSMAECLVEDCDGTIDWNGNDPIQQVLLPRML